MNKNILISIITVIIIAAAVIAALKLIDAPPTPEELKEEAAEEAQSWIENNSPTYKFDGMNLELTEITEVDNGKFIAVFEFDSRQAGYGDRTGQMLAQVITPHEIVISIETARETGEWKITSAVTDGVYDEKAAERLDE